MAKYNNLITVTAGTPVNAVYGTAAQILAAGLVYPLPPVVVQSWNAMMATGGTGRGYVMDGIYGATGTAPRVPASTTATDVTAEIGPATATAPGPSYGETAADGGSGIDISQLWFDGSHTADTIRFTYRTKD